MTCKPAEQIVKYTDARRARMLSPSTLLHIIQRGNNRHQCYLAWLAEYASATGCETHSYALMTDHVYPLVSATHAGDPGNLMKRLGQRDV